MKRALAILVFTLGSSAFAGITYDVQSDSTGLRAINITGKVSVDGQRMRVDIAKGDKMMFKDNSIVLSNDGGKTMMVFDPSAKTYYELHLQDVIGSATSMLGNLPGVKISFDNPHVAVKDAGDGGAIEGFPTHKCVLDASYDINVDAMGQKMTTHTAMNTESWTTDQLSSEFSTFLQARGLRTGIPAIDSLIEAQTTAMKGMPLKQVSTITINQGGSDMKMVTTSTVTNIVRTSIDASRFAMPAGYTKVDDPMTAMMKQLKQ